MQKIYGIIPIDDKRSIESINVNLKIQLTNFQLNNKIIFDSVVKFMNQ